MVIHVHHDLRKMFSTLLPTVYLLVQFSYNNPSRSFFGSQISIHYFIIELQYNHVLTL